MQNCEEARCTAPWKKCKQLAGTCWLAIRARLIGQADSRIWRASLNVNEFKTSRAALKTWRLTNASKTRSKMRNGNQHKQQTTRGRHHPIIFFQSCSNTSLASGFAKRSASWSWVSILRTQIPSLELVGEPLRVMCDLNQ